ncbi:phage tail tip lysozyme [uncultured Roseibium sp.]|uniref:phage tail tip lysozyme n=1 Tax=uncultured Roseibium sp. TaxID=1936171 RepID=UPI0026276EBC|nr:phage tail tip lysozyme [uncultured Roseibium sp.]
MRGRMPEVGIRLAAVDGKAVQRELRRFGTEGEQALRRIERASKPARRSLKAVDAAVDDLKTSASGMSSNLGAAGAGLRAMGPAGAAAAIGIGALSLGFAKVVTSSRDAARSVAEIGDAARRAGLDFEPFQELQLFAERNRIAVDALTDGMKELNLRADEFILTGAGPAAEAFQRLGFSAAELKRELENPSDLLVEIIERLEKFDRAAQIRIADEIFGGTAGERFVELIDRGSDNLRRMIQESRDLGLIFDAEVIKRAEELDSELTKASQTINRSLTRALLDAAPAMQALTEFLATALDGFSSLIDLTRDVEDQSTLRVQERYIKLVNEGILLRESIAGLERRDDSIASARLKVQRERLTLIEAEAAALRELLDVRSGKPPEGADATPSTSSQNDDLLLEEERKRLEKLAEVWVERITPAADKYQETLRDIAAAEEQGFLTASQAADARTKAAEDYQKVIDKLNATGNRDLEKRLSEVKRLIETSRAPAEELAARLQRIAELENEGLFARAGGNADDARVAAMRDYASATDDAAAALERLEQIASGDGPSRYAAQLVVAERRTNDLREATAPLREELSDSLADAIVNGEELSDVLEKLAKQILRDFLAGQFNFLLGGPAPTDFLSRLLGSITGGRVGGFGGGGGATSVSSYSPPVTASASLPAAAASAIAPSTGGSVASQVWRYFLGKGLQPHQVAGIVGNVSAESAFNPFAIGDGGNAFGLFQHNDRRHRLFDFIGGRQNLGNVGSQLDFAWHELQTTENRSFRDLLASRNVREATAAFGGFERPSGFSYGNPEAMHNWTGRLQAAEEALNVFGGDLTTASSGLTRFDGGVSKAIGSLAEGSTSLANTATSFAGQSQDLAGTMAEGLQNVFSGLGDGAGGASGGGGFSGFFSGIFKGLAGVFGFNRGGSTGPGADSDVAGFVHANEYVFSAPATRRIGVGVLDQIHGGALMGFRSGGYVTPYAATGSSSAMRGQAANDGQSKIEVHNYSNAQVDVEESRDERGGRSTKFVISEQVADSLSLPGGAAQRTLGRTYGVKKQRAKR